jgi:stringent starvation protein B
MTKSAFFEGYLDLILENGWTPLVVVDAARPGVSGIPRERLEDGKVVLDVGPEACPDFTFDGETLQGTLRFGGVATTVVIPVEAVLELLVRENELGVIFADEDRAGEGDEAEDPKPAPPGGRRRLYRVK